MASAPTPWFDLAESRPWLKPWGLGFLALAVFAGVALVTLRAEDKFSDIWTTVYLPAARAIRTGEAMPEGYAYPPAMALVSIPFTYLPTPMARVAFAAMNLAALIVLFAATNRLTGGKTLTRPLREDIATLAIAFFVAGRFVISPIEARQTDLLIAAALLAGLAGASDGRSFIGGVFIGAATAMKLTPAPVIVFLALKRRFLAASVAIAVVLGLDLAPDLVLRRPDGLGYMKGWLQDCVAPLAGRAAGAWWVDPAQNQSFAGLVHRLTSSLSSATPDVWTWSLWACLVGATTVTTGWVVLSSRDQSDGSLSPAAWGAVVTLTLLISPMTSKAHGAVLLLPAAALARQWLERRDSRMGILLVLLAALQFGSAKGIVGKQVGDWLLLIGAPLALFACWWTAMLWLARQESRPLTKSPRASRSPQLDSRRRRKAEETAKLQFGLWEGDFVDQRAPRVE